MDIGLFLPTQVESSMPLLENLDWDREKETVRICEEFGLESVAVPDHLQWGSGGNLETFTILASLAEYSFEVNLLPLVASVPFRNPALVAKISATLDVISGGRFQLGIGAGWFENEFEAYGYDFESPSVRVDRLEEAAQLIPRLWTEDEVDYQGEYYTAQGAVCEPKPSNPYLIVGGEGPRVQRIAENYADEWNFLGSFEEMLDRAHEVEDTRVSWFGAVLVSRDEEYLEDITNRAYPDRPGRYIAGPPEIVSERLEVLEEHGVERTILRMMDYPRRESLEKLGEEVISEL